MKSIDLTGQRFTRLTVISRAENAGRRTAWHCKCDCGSMTVATTMCLRAGYVKSCGCLLREATAKRNRENAKHGQARTRMFKIWGGIKNRCLNPGSKDYPNYGGRGVKICAKWENNFTAFRDWAIAHGYTDRLTIERINANGDYAPDNCKWIPAEKQAANRRCCVTYQGLCIAEWCRRTGISYAAVMKRIYKGWDMERAIFTPTRAKRNHA